LIRLLQVIERLRECGAWMTQQICG